MRLGESFQLGMLIRAHREKGLFLSVYVDDIRLAVKKQKINPIWKVLNKGVDFGRRTSFFDHVHLGCDKLAKILWTKNKTMFDFFISAGATEKLPCSENLSISSWSYEREGHAKTMCGTIL